MTPSSKILRTGLVAAFALLGATSAGADAASDSALQESLQSEFNESVHAPYYIEVTVDEGVVRLAGKLPDEAARRRAERTVRETDGVLGLVDDTRLEAQAGDDRP